LAHGGTIFLDEVGDLPRRVQVRLLHALQDGRFHRVGGTEMLDVDMRLIAATNRDLEDDVQKGRFRRDLFVRVNLVSLHIPPLRERPDEIGALVEHFLQRFAEDHGKSTVTMSADALDHLFGHDWPGNVRELSNVIERAVIISENDGIELWHLPEYLQRAKTSSSGELIAIPLGGNLEDIERHVISEMIARCNGNKAEAARRLGMHRRTLYRVMQRGASIPAPALPQNGPRMDQRAADCG
jgi:DNA-binding NtrC family response regulator